jgi:L-methionine (R)-S-oxide reductase
VCQFIAQTSYKIFFYYSRPISPRKSTLSSSKNCVRLSSMTTTNIKPTDLIPELNALPAKAASGEALMKAIVTLLHEKLTRYNWVGFYMLERKGGDTLVLGSFNGTMTPHTRIPLNQGICGAAASSGKTIIVDDVNSDSRYLACSLETKSEIVVPVFVHGIVVGELDIDSHFLAAFGPDDRKLCEHAATILGKFLESRA